MYCPLCCELDTEANMTNYNEQEGKYRCINDQKCSRIRKQKTYDERMLERLNHRYLLHVLNKHNKRYISSKVLFRWEKFWECVDYCDENITKVDKSKLPLEFKQNMKFIFDNMY